MPLLGNERLSAVDRGLKAVIRQLADQRACPVEHIEHYVKKGFAKILAFVKSKSGEMTLKEAMSKYTKELKEDLERYLGERAARG